MPIKNKFYYFVVVLLVLLLVAAGYYLVKVPSPLTPKPKFADSDILFSAVTRSGSSAAMSIYKLAPDGKVTELVASGYIDMLNATYSPDLSKIAFVATHDSKQVIAVMGADGSNVHQVSKLDGPKLMPSWSSDGKKILYALSKQGGGAAVIDLDAGTDTVEAVGTDLVQSPAWLPDEQWFSYVSLDMDQTAGKVRTHFVVKGDEVKFKGDNNVQLIDMGSPAVSPNGKQVAFVRSSDSQIYVAGIDGSGLREVGKSKDTLFSCPSWSKDSSFLYASESSNDGKFYITKIDVGSGTMTRSDLSGYNKINCPRAARY